MEIQIFGDGHDGEVRTLREENSQLRAELREVRELLKLLVLIVDECGLPVEPALRERIRKA